MAAYDGASAQELSLTDWNSVAGSADADLLPDLRSLTARSRDLDRNNGIMAGGTLRLSTAPDYRLLGKTIDWALEWGHVTEAKFRSWADSTEVDAGRTLNLLGMSRQVLGGAMRIGHEVAAPALVALASGLQWLVDARGQPFLAAPWQVEPQFG